MTSALVLLPNGEQTFLDANGAPLALGTVGFYVPSTLTPKNTWLDRAGVTLNSNPLMLDAAGRCVVFGSGAYRQIVLDVNGATIWDKETLGLAEVTGTWSVVTADPNPCVAGARYLVNTASGGVSMTLPASPTIGDEIDFADATGTFGTNNLTVARNAKPIMGSANDLIDSTNNLSFGLVYEGAIAGWRVIQI